MSAEKEGPSEVLQELLSTLEHLLSVERIGEIQRVIDYDEPGLAFVMLIAALGRSGAAVPQETSALFLRLGGQLQIDTALWRDVCKPIVPSR